LINKFQEARPVIKAVKSKWDFLKREVAAGCKKAVLAVTRHGCRFRGNKKVPELTGTLNIFCFLKSEAYFFLAAFLAAFFLGAAFFAAFLGAAFFAAFLGAAFFAAFLGAAFFAAFFFVAIFLKFNWLVNNT
jgi:hypothetical protein